MRKIKIKNFGPIKEGYQEADGWINIAKVTVFIGNQGSGKSSVAKLISTFSWIEKVLTRGDYDTKWFTRKNKFRNTYCGYHRLENYFKEDTVLEYIGFAYRMVYEYGELLIFQNDGSYRLPQIMYVPAERNFISTLKSPKLLKLSSDSLVEFLTEFDNAKNELNELKEDLKLPINDSRLEYDKLNDLINIKGPDYKVRLTESSSGFQSIVPLFLVSWFLSNSVRQSETNRDPSVDERERFKKSVSEIMSNNDLTDEQKRAALSALAGKFNKTAFINIVEEPEQNLFPGSQRHLLNSLLEFNNAGQGNELILTTHSPYVINFLSIAIQADYLRTSIVTFDKLEYLEKVYEIVPNKSHIAGYNVIIYQLNEKDGSIQKLPTFEGIPSDKNYLNKFIQEGNTLFDSLLEIEQSL